MRFLRSYRLTGNLTKAAGGGSDSLILINVDDVTLDLGGFSLIGPGACTRSAATGVVSCTGHLGGAGIEVGSVRNTIVRNGRVAGLTSGITSFGDHATFEDLALIDNLGQGLGATGEGTVVRRVTARRNDGTGIVVVGNASIDSCTASHNDEYGLSVISESVVTRCHVIGNRFDGMELSSTSVFKDNVVSANYGSDPVRNGIDGGGNVCATGGSVAVGC